MFCLCLKIGYKGQQTDNTMIKTKCRFKKLHEEWNSALDYATSFFRKCVLMPNLKDSNVESVWKERRREFKQWVVRISLLWWVAHRGQGKRQHKQNEKTYELDRVVRHRSSDRYMLGQGREDNGITEWRSCNQSELGLASVELELAARNAIFSFFFFCVYLLCFHPSLEYCDRVLVEFQTIKRLIYFISFAVLLNISIHL